MSWKQTANALLHRTTGHMLTSETPEQREEEIRKAARKAAARARRKAAAQAKENAAARQRRQAAKRARRKSDREKARIEAKKHSAESVQESARRRLLSSHDENLVAVVEQVRPRTMTAPTKLAPLIEATRHVVAHRIPGEIVECGVWRGGSMQAVALTLISCGDIKRELHLFDTFEGMPAPTDEDQRLTSEGVVAAEELLMRSAKDSRMWAVAGLDDVKAGMGETRYPSELVHYHPGLVENTTPGEAPETIAILRLDTDWYASTKHELEHLYDRLSPGGVLILDDYGDWEGARKATDEWLATTGEQIFLAPMGSGRIGIKPLR